MKIHKLEKPQKTFFFERHDGSVISVGEREAWNIYNNRNQVVGWLIPKPKLIGVSDGMKMYEAVKKAHEVFVTNPDEAQNILRQGNVDELEAARGNIVAPRNADKMGDGAEFI